MPRTLTPARQAIVAALTTATGKTNALGPRLFQLMPPARGAERGKLLMATPGVWVAIKNAATTGNPLLDQSTTQGFALTAEITCSYWSGDPKNPAEVERTQAMFEEDGPRVVSALTSEALHLAPNGISTGIIGGQLLRVGYSSRGPDPWPLDTGAARLVRVVHVFPFLVELSTT